MTMRRHLARLRDLQRVQRVERDLAQRDHAEACDRADAARIAADSATEQASAASERWYAGRTSGRFLPEPDDRLAVALVVAERAATDAAQAAVTADADRARRADEWRLADARRRATARVVHDVRRDLARIEDEARLDIVMTRALHGVRP